MNKINIKGLTICAILLAFAVVINVYTSFIIPVAGVNILEIKFGNPFIRFAALLFGGPYGGIVGALEDLIRHFIKPLGAYLWPLTLVELLKGFLIGVLWFKIKNLNVKIFKSIYIVITAIFIVVGALTLVLNTMPQNFYIEFLLKFAQSNYIRTFSITVLCAGVVGLAAIIPTYFMKEEANRFLKIVVATGIPCLLFSTVNSILFKYIYFPTANVFMLYWTIRISKEIIQVLLNAYILVIFFNIYEKINGKVK